MKRVDLCAAGGISFTGVLTATTEVGWVSIATPEDLRQDPQTAGRPPLYTSVRLLGQDGLPVSDGKVGRIFVKSSLVFGGYTDGQTKEIVDGCMSTGDTGYVDELGRLRVEGRDDDMIVSGGENVFPGEVEFRSAIPRNATGKVLKHELAATSDPECS